MVEGAEDIAEEMEEVAEIEDDTLLDWDARLELDEEEEESLAETEVLVARYEEGSLDDTDPLVEIEEEERAIEDPALIESEVREDGAELLGEREGSGVETGDAVGCVVDSA